MNKVVPMILFNLKRRFKVLGMALVLAMAGFCLPGAAQTATLTVVDLHGRSVTLKTPLERLVVLESAHVQEVAAILGEEFVHKIVGWDASFKKHTPDCYAKFLHKFPQIKDIPQVGSMYEGTLNIEKVIMLKPDLIIAHEGMFTWGAESTKTSLTRLDQAGIPVLFLDYYMRPLQNATKSTLLLGRILGREKRAREIVDFYDHQMDLTLSRLKNIRSPRPKVYLECAYEGPTVYGASYGDLAWGSIIKKSRGQNIAEPILGDIYNPLSPEYVIHQNPDIIILTGGDFKPPGSVKMGYLTEAAETRRTMRPYVDRPGWSLLSAVKNRKVYSIYHEFTFGIYNFAAVQALAKWSYPEEFKDIDPNAALKEYHKRFMPIDFSGTFICSFF